MTWPWRAIIRLWNSCLLVSTAFKKSNMPPERIPCASGVLRGSFLRTIGAPVTSVGKDEISPKPPAPAPSCFRKFLREDLTRLDTFGFVDATMAARVHQPPTG